MKFSAILLLSGTLALAGCGQKTETSSNDVSLDTNISSANEVVSTEAPAASLLTAQGFANAAAASDKFEIESAKLAQASGSSSAVKSFATKMIAAHTGSTAKLKVTTGAMNPALTPDDTLSAAQQQDLDTLKGLTGVDFDKAYAAAQVKAHQAALDALNGYAAGGDAPALKDFAKGLVPTVTAHLNMANSLK